MENLSSYGLDIIVSFCVCCVSKWALWIIRWNPYPTSLRRLEHKRHRLRLLLGGTLPVNQSRFILYNRSRTYSPPSKEVFRTRLLYLRLSAFLSPDLHRWRPLLLRERASYSSPPFIGMRIKTPFGGGGGNRTRVLQSFSPLQRPI